MRAFLTPISCSLKSPLYFMTFEPFLGTEVNSYQEVRSKLLERYIIKEGQPPIPFFISFMPSKDLDQVKAVGDAMAAKGMVNLLALPKVKEIKILRTCRKYGECEEDARHDFVIFNGNEKSYWDGHLSQLLEELHIF